MKIINKLTITYLLSVLLLGCSSKPKYQNAVYYESHIAEAQKVIDYCKSQDKDFVKALQKDQNCRNANYAIELPKFMGGLKNLQKQQ